MNERHGYTFGPGGWGLSQRSKDDAKRLIGMHELAWLTWMRTGRSPASLEVLFKESMDRTLVALRSIVGIYEEQAARKQYDILGDGSV